MGENGDRVEDDPEDRPDETLEDFRKEVQAENGKGAEAGPPKGEEADAPDEEAASPASKEQVGEGDGRLSDEDLNEFRRQIVDEYGPDGGGEDPFEDKLYDVAPEERGGGEGSGVEGQTEKDTEAKAGDREGGSEPTREAGNTEAQEESEKKASAAEGDSASETKAGGADATEEAGKEVQADTAGERKNGEEPLESGTDASRAAATGAEVHNVNDNQILVTEQESPEGKSSAGPEVETWDFHHFPASEQADQGGEERIFEAADCGKGAVARFPKSDLEENGAELEPGENAVVGMRLRDVQTEEEETAFARFNAQDRRAEAYVDDIGGEKGSRYELLEAWKVDEDRLVSEFERGRCEHLENVRLEHTDEKMFVVVDDRGVELTDHRISTSGAHAVLRGDLDGDDRCKIEFDGLRASVKFGRDYPVEGMRMEGDELVVRYAQSRNEKHEHRLYLEHPQEPERPLLNQFGKQEMLEGSRVGRYNQNDNQVVVTKLEKPGKDHETSDGTNPKDAEKFESVDVVRRAIKYMSSTALYIPDGTLPEHTPDDVISVRIARERESWKEYVLYCRETPGEKVAYLDLKQIGAEIGERFRITHKEVLRPETFVRDYNHAKPKGLENTKLLIDGTTVKMNVDGAELKLEGARLRSQEGSAVLEASLAGQKPFKIVESQRGFALRLEDHSPIVSMTRSEKFVTMSYTRTRHDAYPHRTDIELERVEPKEMHKIEFTTAHLKIERVIEEELGRIRVEFSADCRAMARTYWKEGIDVSQQERDYHIGDIGEAVARMAFRESDFVLLPREVYRKGGTTLVHDSEYRGPDLVVAKMGEHVVYVKHWKEKSKALGQAKYEVTRFERSEERIDLEGKLGTRIRGGFAIELDWSYDEPLGVIYMEYVKYQ